MIWDFSEAIRSQKVVKIRYITMDSKEIYSDKFYTKELLPQEILFSDYYFYLVAFVKENKREYPNVYRLDKIKQYKVYEERFKINYSRRVNEWQFRNSIEFIQVSRVENIKFKFKGECIESVLDRLPTAEIIEEKKGEYTIKAKIFGSGIKRWFLSQEDSLEILEPKQFREEIKNTIENMRKIYEKN